MHRPLILSFVFDLHGESFLGSVRNEVKQAKADDSKQFLSEGKIGRFKPTRLAEGIIIILDSKEGHLWEWDLQ